MRGEGRKARGERRLGKRNLNWRADVHLARYEFIYVHVQKYVPNILVYKYMYPFNDFG